MNRPAEKPSIQKTPTSPKSKPPGSVPGPVTMPGSGQALGGGTPTRPPNPGERSGQVVAARRGGEASAGRQSTPDPEEVRRRRLAFLDKQSQSK